MQNNKKLLGGHYGFTARVQAAIEVATQVLHSYSTSVKIQISGERQAGTSLKHKTIPKPVVCAAAVLALSSQKEGKGQKQL